MSLGSLVRLPALRALVFLILTSAAASQPAEAFPTSDPQGVTHEGVTHEGATREGATNGRATSGGAFDGAARSAFPKWWGVIDHVAAWPGAGEPDAGAAGCADEGDCGLGRWRDFLASLRDERPAEWLRDVNAYVNQVRYLPDSGNWGELDYWAAPDQFFARGGDCEDYAIAKYFSLKMLGFPVERMRIVVLNDKRLSIAHAVLEVRLGDDAFVLDNRYERIVRWAEVTHYRPIYSVNEANFWVHTGAQPTAPWEQQATAAGAASAQ